jgi:hypothetical protein
MVDVHRVRSRLRYSSMVDARGRGTVAALHPSWWRTALRVKDPKKSLPFCECCCMVLA